MHQRFNLFPSVGGISTSTVGEPQMEVINDKVTKNPAQYENLILNYVLKQVTNRVG